MSSWYDLIRINSIEIWTLSPFFPLFDSVRFDTFKALSLFSISEKNLYPPVKKRHFEIKIGFNFTENNFLTFQNANGVNLINFGIFHHIRKNVICQFFNSILLKITWNQAKLSKNETFHEIYLNHSSRNQNVTHTSFIMFRNAK